MALSKILENSITDGVISAAKLKDFSAAVDLNGVELILDADQDTSITADTDDVIDFKIAGVEHISLSNSSGDTIIKPRVDGKDIIFQQFDGKKLFEINDGNFVSVGGNNVASGQIRIFEDTDNGSHYSGFTVGNLTESYVLALPNADGSSGQALTTNGSGVLSFSTVSANVPTSADGQALGSASLEWSDLFLADGAVINFGADQDINLTHVADTGLTTNGTFTTTGLILGSTAVTSTAAELNLIDGGTSRGTTAVADADGLLTNDGGTMRMTSAATFKTYFQEGISTAYDDFTIGDAAVLITTSSGNITIDAAANDSDIIFKGTDGGADKVFATFDGSAGGDLFLNGGLIDLKNDGSNVSQIKFYCESSNAHAQTLIGAPHSESGSNTLTLPSSGGDSKLLSATSTATVTNKTLTTPKINENVALTSTATELNFNDGVTLGTAIASKIVTTDGNIDTTGMRNLTISGELDAATLDISGAIDVAGTSNLDVVDIDGAVDMASTLQVDGVATFTAVPVFPNNTIETADIQADAITGAKIADDAINSEHYTDGSIDTAHLADGQVTTAKLATAVLIEPSV